MAHNSEEATSGSPGTPLLECQNLKRTFAIRGRQIQALDGIDMSANKGEIVVICGRSGAGKSTLLSVLGGLDRPSSGSVIFEGRGMDSLSNRELALLRRTKIGIIFQSLNLLPSWTALENVEAALIHTAMSRTERHTKAEALLNDLGLGDRLDHLPLELSLGEQQRVAIARTLANEPALILADEPTADVDEQTAREIVDHLLGPVKENDVTLLIATHGIIPRDIADRVLWMKDGRLVPQEEERLR